MLKIKFINLLFDEFIKWLNTKIWKDRLCNSATYFSFNKKHTVYISLLIWLIQLLFYYLKFIENVFDLFNIKFVHVILIKKEPNFIFYYLYHVANCANKKQILNIMVLFIFDWQTVVCVKKSINVFKTIWMSCLISIFVLFEHDRRGYELSEMLNNPKVLSSFKF
jgi:hypothetical protein